MQKVLAAVLAVAMFIVLIATVTYAQSTSNMARLSPFVIDISQTVPVSLTIKLPLQDGEQLTTTVPAEFDVMFRVEMKADEALAPTIEVAPARDVLVSVTELMEAGQPLIDNWGFPYEVENVTDLEIIQWTVSEDFADDFHLVGEVRNTNSSRAIDKFDVNIVVTLYDPDGRILEAANGYIALASLQPGQTTPFELTTSTGLNQVGRYLVQIEVDD